jgi:hypothetical protein
MFEKERYDLAEQFKDIFAEIDSDITVELKETDGDYTALCSEILFMQMDFPVIANIIEGEGAISVSEEEHKALVRYFEAKNEMYAIERMEIYFRGHADGFAYLKKIGVI